MDKGKISGLTCLKWKPIPAVNDTPLLAQFFPNRYSGKIKDRIEPALVALDMEQLGIVVCFRESCA